MPRRLVPEPEGRLGIIRVMSDGGRRWLALLALPHTRRVVAEVVAVAVAVAVGLFAASLVWQTVEVGPLTLTARMAFGTYGETSLRIPPFGQAHAHTHTGPAQLIVTVEAVDIPGVQQLLLKGHGTAPEDGRPTLRSQTAEATQSVSNVLAEGSRTVGRYLLDLVLLAGTVAALAAAAAAWALRRRLRVIAGTAGIALTIVLGSGLLAGATFDPSAIRSPHLQGALAYLPRLQAVLAGRLDRIEALRAQAADVAQNLAAYYADPRSIAAGGGLPGTYRVLHVGDLHLDPIGAELARSLARSYDASLVIDTGDIVILGGREETALLPSLVVTSTPVLFVPGNHDSLQVARGLARLPNVTVATSETVVIDGLTIFTLPDPSGLSAGIVPDERLIRTWSEESAQSLRERAASGLPPPDIVATHSPRAWREFEGLAPLVLAGHTHVGRLDRGEATTFLNSGTLGGMPYDPVTTGRPRLPHGASILYYTQGIPKRLIAIDRISVGVDGTTELDRTVIDESLLP